jgi:hypothetical protein
MVERTVEGVEAWSVSLSRSTVAGVTDVVKYMMTYDELDSAAEQRDVRR